LDVGGSVTGRRSILFLLGAASAVAVEHSSLDSGSALAAEYADCKPLLDINLCSSNHLCGIINSI
jgi:hypothetical protein